MIIINHMFNSDTQEQRAEIEARRGIFRNSNGEIIMTAELKAETRARIETKIAEYKKQIKSLQNKLKLLIS
jgi:hypothetical protein